ncbi:MAG: D-alanyl-D-alanine carboxypeptidase [Alphaproteobacteria bacterium]|nr:D-alanyl-D-alanine carboxypeptidase [Alphaproteobacteria bacterium]
MKKFFTSATSFFFRVMCFVCIIATCFCIGIDDASAAKKKKTKSANAAENKRYSAIVVDVQTGEVLMAKYADSIRYPASLTKIMTLYMTFDAIEHGKLSLNDRITISSHASKMSPSKLGLPVGSSIRVEDAIKAIVTKSANDIAVALGEKLAGSERNFATRMTRKARELGMSRTQFRNASGLPDLQQQTTARDMAKLAMAMLRDFPKHYHYFGIRNFEYNGVSHHNHNRLLGQYRGLDGIKTGYINASGFNLVASAKQNGRRLVGVVFGGQSWRSRNDHMVKLLDEGFATLATRGPQLQEAALHGTPPIPVPPPIREDAAYQTADTNADSTDDAEDDGAYSPNGSQQVASMIGTVQAQNYEQEEKQAPKLASIEPPLPARKSYREVEEDYPAVSNSSAATQPAKAARTVMQLRIPRSQLPKGLNPAQIIEASNDNDGDWSIQIGAFQSRAMTDQALRTAQARLPNNLQGGRPVIVPQNTNAGLIFRARLQGYSEIQANAACAHLGSCLVVSPGS